MQKNSKKKTLGRIGEDLTAKYLMDKGIRIIQRNWVYKHKEIDIIAEDDEWIMIVEVKTRNIHFMETAGEMIPIQKQSFLIEAADAFITEREIEKETRFDVVIVVFDNNVPTIDYIEDAFQPGII